METYLTFGFNRAVSIVMDAIDNLHSTAMSHHRVMVVEVMGRYAGWLALFAGVAGGGDVLLLPEIPYDLESIFRRVIDRSNHGKRFSIVVVAEGVVPKGEKLEKTKSWKSQLGGIGNHLSNLIQEKTDLETRPVILGHLQRGGPPTAFDRLLATQFGVKAADLIDKGEFGRMASLKGKEIVSVPMKDAIKNLKLVPADHSLIRAARAVGTCFGIED